MEGTYDVIMAGEDIGTVAVKSQGLYYVFECSCRLTGEVMCDLVMRIGDSCVKLGLLTPQNGRFDLNVRLPKKRAVQGIPVFSLQPHHSKTDEHFVSVSPEEPFHYLSRLEKAYLARKDGQIGLIIDQEK